MGGSTFVLVHAGFHGGWCWRQVANDLRAATQTRVASLAGLLALLQRWTPLAALRAPQRLEKGATTWIAQPLGRTDCWKSELKASG